MELEDSDKSLSEAIEERIVAHICTLPKDQWIQVKYEVILKFLRTGEELRVAYGSVKPKGKKYLKAVKDDME